MDDDQQRARLRAGFSEDPEAFQRTRPVCPPRAFDDLVELSAGLAAVAWHRLARFPSSQVLTTSFEDWEPPGTPFDAVVAFNALHWIDPRLRYAKPAALLPAGDQLIVGGCRWARRSGALLGRRAAGLPGRRLPRRPAAPAGADRPVAFPGRGRRLLRGDGEPALPVGCCLLRVRLPGHAGQPVRHPALGPARSPDFLAWVRRRLEALGSPPLTAAFVGTLTIGRRREARAGQA